jgi:general secretion pathway protein K
MIAVMRAGEGQSRGFALIIVLWFLMTIAAIGSFLVANARSETAIARNVRLSASAEALADAGVAAALFNQTDPVLGNRWRLDGAVHDVALLGGQASIHLVDENEKVNPNHAPDMLLAGLFEALGIDGNVASRLGAAIADWVGPENQPHPLGAKKQQYAAAGRSYGPPNAPMETLDELELVLGMTPELLALVRPYLSIYAEADEPDPRNASPAIRRALLLAARKSDVADAAQAQGDAPDAPPAPPSIQPVAATGPNKAVAQADAPVIGLDIVARTAGGGVFVREAIVRLDTANPKGYVVLDWRRGELSP